MGTAHSEGTVILNKWGIPLSGLTRQSGQTLFFLCLEGEVSSANLTNLWGYIPLDSREEDAVIGDHSHDAFERLIQDGRTWVAALSIERQGIVKWAYVEEVRSGETALDAALRSLHMNEQDLSRFLASA